MSDSRFTFIKNDILQKNLDETFVHITHLLISIDSPGYDRAATSLFRKSIIIHTAAIIEALLLYILENKYDEKDIAEFYATWELRDKKELYSVNENTKIIDGTYIKIPGKTTINKMNFGQLIDFLHTKKKLNDELYLKLDKVRLLRNEQHIGTRKNVKEYSKSDLDFVFSVAHEIKHLAKLNS